MAPGKPSGLSPAAVILAVLGALSTGVGAYILVTAAIIGRRPGVEEYLRLGLVIAVPLVLVGMLLSSLAWGLWRSKAWAVARPVGVSVLAIAVCVVALGALVIGAFSTVFTADLLEVVGPQMVLGSAVLIVPGVLLALLAWGTWTLKRWAWPCLVVLSVIGLLAQVRRLDLADVAIAAGVLYYLFRPGVQAAFGHGRPSGIGAGGPVSPDAATASQVTAAPRSVSSESSGRRGLWKAYFVVMAVLGSVGMVAQGTAPLELIDSAVAIVALAGLFAFSWRRHVLGTTFWRAFLPIFVVWNVAYLYFLPLSPQAAELMGVENLPRPVSATFTLAVLTPLGVALYRLATPPARTRSDRGSEPGAPDR